MNQILRCDRLLERARWSNLLRSGLPAVSRKKFPRKPYNKSFIDQACSVKMAGYWPRSFFASLWTSTPSIVFFFCKSSDSLEHAFLECPAALNFFQKVLTWFNNEHRVNSTPSKIQLLFKDYDLPPKYKPKPNLEVWDFSCANSKILWFWQNVGKNFKFSWTEVSAIFATESLKMRKLN